MDKVYIEDVLMKYCKDLLKDAERYCSDYNSVINMRGIAYGAVQFTCNYLFDEYNKELADWWDNEMVDNFTRLAIDK